MDSSQGSVCTQGVPFKPTCENKYTKVESDSLLWVVSHVCEESREHATDDIISKANENAIPVRFDEIWCAEHQAPECLDEFPLAVGYCCLSWSDPECIPVPIAERIRKLGSCQ